VILTARDPDRLHRVGLELGASIAPFDATDFERLGRFFDGLPMLSADRNASPSVDRVACRPRSSIFIG
jgi:hypothetical protein